MLVDIIAATVDDEDRVFDFLQKYFYPDEPLNSALQRPPPTTKEECSSALSILAENLSLLAVERDDHSQLCGVFLNKVLIKKPKDRTWEVLIDQYDGTPYGKILKFLDFANAKFYDVMNDLWDQTKTESAIDACITVVRSDCRRQHVGALLMERTIEMAKKNKMNWLTIKCTSVYSAAMASKYGFTETYYLPYTDYKDEQNEIVFKVPEPHQGFKAYTKYLQH